MDDREPTRNRDGLGIVVDSAYFKARRSSICPQLIPDRTERGTNSTGGKAR